jgi:hypothetical protein
MSNTKIQCKNEEHSFGVWPAREKVSTTLCLVSMGGGKVGLTYESTFSGVKDGSVQGGPIEVPGNLQRVINDSPKVTITVTEYQNTGTYASIHVEITVDIPVLGTKTIYSQTLGGNYSAQMNGWSSALTSFSKAVAPPATDREREAGRAS